MFYVLQTDVLGSLRHEGRAKPSSKKYREGKIILFFRRQEDSTICTRQTCYHKVTITGYIPIFFFLPKLGRKPNAALSFSSHGSSFNFYLNIFCIKFQEIIEINQRRCNSRRIGNTSTWLWILRCTEFDI